LETVAGHNIGVGINAMPTRGEGKVKTIVAWGDKTEELPRAVRASGPRRNQGITLIKIDADPRQAKLARVAAAIGQFISPNGACQATISANTARRVIATAAGKGRRRRRRGWVDGRFVALALDVFVVFVFGGIL